MLESLAPVSNICRDISQSIITLPWTVWGQSQNPIFILNTPLLHAGSPVCSAGWLNLLAWVETREPQPLVSVGFGGTWGSLGGNGEGEGSVLRSGCLWDTKAGRCTILIPKHLILQTVWPLRWVVREKAASSGWEWRFGWLNFHSWEPPTLGRGP